jgi:hypothetical protein
MLSSPKKRFIIFALFLCALLFLSNANSVFCWSNNGFSTDPANPDYGTHDWIAQHALDWLPTNEKQYLLDNLAKYLYGTELPDNNDANVPGHIGDTYMHHVYFRANGALQDDSAATRAATMFQTALTYLNAKDYPNATLTIGIMTHYIDDVAVWAHVMGASTDWGTEASNIHSNYESYVNSRTDQYVDTYNTYLSFDGSLTTLSAYNASLNLAYDSTFDNGGIYTCVWMNNSYSTVDPNSPYWNRAGESINLAVNALADVLHTLYINSNEVASTPTSILSPTPAPTPTNSPIPTVTPTVQTTNMPSPSIPEFKFTILSIALLIITVIAAVVLKRKTKLW